MRLQNKKKSKLKWFLFILIGLFFLAAGYIAWIYTSSQTDQPTTEDTQQETTLQEDRTYTDTTEGQDITVPDNVDPSSIKDYTLITENETYKIRELNGEYYITLYAIINRPSQSDMYRDQLRQYKQAALDYLKNHNVNLAEVAIHYEPAEAADL